MGIYDREYYRREGPSFLGSFTSRGQVCKWLIGANIILFVLQLLTQPPNAERVIFERDGEAIVARQPQESPFTSALVLDSEKVVYGGQVWRLLTYAFLHDPSNLMHILFNMLFLWWFGADIEDLYGPKEFLCFYLVSAVIGGICFLLTSVVGLSGTRCLGASGAVMAVMVLCAIHYPRRIILLFFVLPVPIWGFVIFMVAKDAYLFLNRADTNLAVAVHLGGATFAYVYYKCHWQLSSWWPQFRAWQRQLFRPKLRVYYENPPRPMPVASPPDADVDEQLEAKLDAVLEKVARFGRASLSESENKILMRASEVYKRRRT